MVIRGVILREYFGIHAFGKMLGLVMGVASVGGIIGPTVAGWAYDTMGSYQWVWPGFVAVQIVSVGLSLKIKSTAAAVSK